MCIIQNFEIVFFTRKTPPSTALRDLVQIRLVLFAFRFWFFAVELAIRPRFLVMRKVWHQSWFEKEIVGQK